jgi:polysaccharide biosynthesis transport protein
MNAHMPARDWQRNAGQVPSEAKALSPRELVRIFVRRLPIVCGFPFVAVLVAMLIFISLTPRYTGTVAILIDPKTPGSLGPGTDFGAAMLIDTTKIASIGSIIQSSAVLEHVVKSEKLYDDPEFGLVRRGFLARLLSRFPGFRGADPSAERTDPIATATGRLRNATSVARDGYSYVINVAVNSSDPVKAAHLAQAVGEAYLNDQLQGKYEAARRASSWLFGRLAEMRKATIDSEEAVAQVRRAYGLTATGENGTSTIASQQITELNAALGAAEVELSLKQVKVEQARAARQSGGNIEGLAAVMASGVITGLRAQRSDIIRKLAEMQPLPSQRDVVARRPEVIRAEEGLRAVEGQISAEEDRIIANLENDYTAARNNVIALREQLKKLTGAGGGENSDGVAKLREAERVANANRQVYDSFLNKFKELEQSQTMQEAEARIIENAGVPTQTSFPRLPLFIMISLGPGLLLGLGGAFVAEYFNSDRMQSTFVTPIQLEQTLRLPMLASVPLLDAGDFEQNGHNLDIIQYVVANQFSHFAEALRCIRVGLRRTDGDKTANVIQITSAIPSEGKSTLAATLALSSALSGARVVLIDCDFRRPMTSKLFHLEKTGGLIDLLAGRAKWAEIANDYSSLTIVPVGNFTQSSLDLICSPQMIEVLKFASEHYDLVFLDSPPILPVSDAAVISSIADKTILLIEWNKTDRELVFQAIDSVHLNKGTVTGVVLNKVNLATIKSYGYNYSKFYTDTEKYYEFADAQSSQRGRSWRLRNPFRGAIPREHNNE